MVSTKYYIYGGGRWREVDAATGRIDGWGRARFLVARRGKLAAVRAGPVLGALRALVEAQPSAARDGPPLPYKYPKEKPVPSKVKNGPQTSCQHCQHCSHANINGGSSFKTRVSNKNKKADPKKVETGIQTTLQFRDNFGKRKRDDTSPDLPNTKVTTVATVHTTENRSSRVESKKPEPKRTKSSALVKSRLQTSGSDQTEVADVRSPRKPRPDLLKSRPLKRKRDNSKEGSSTSRQTAKSGDINEISNVKPNSRFGKKPSNSRPSPKKRRSDNTPSETSSDSHKSKIQVVKRKPNVSLVISSETETESSRSEVKPQRKVSQQKAVKHIPGPKCFQRQRERINQVTDSQGYKFRELIIDEQDVEILRLYIQKHGTSQDLLSFDTDDKYKMKQFYKINPLVSVERCPRIARMLRSESQHSGITIEDFASRLGLRSVSETSQPKRYRTRKRRDLSYVDTQTSDSEDKENFDRRYLRTDKVRHTAERSRSQEVELSETVSNKERRKIRHVEAPVKEGIRDINENVNSRRTIEKKEINNTENNTKDRDNNTTVVSSSDSEKQFKTKPIVKNPVLKKPKVISIKRRALKEYSNLEDHAIVSWVSLGGRACCVNGNRLWRDLQQQYARLTGQPRSWHSLRNRYLRYILPRLGSLALPPSLQTRLRAAAATGEMKKSKAGQRRNSIFAPPLRGAASRPRARLRTPSVVRTPSPRRRGRPRTPSVVRSPSPRRRGRPRTSSVVRNPSPRRRGRPRTPSVVRTPSPRRRGRPRTPSPRRRDRPRAPSVVRIPSPRRRGRPRTPSVVRTPSPRRCGRPRTPSVSPRRRAPDRTAKKPKQDKGVGDVSSPRSGAPPPRRRAPPAPSPRYSDITRQFARRLARSSDSQHSKQTDEQKSSERTRKSKRRSSSEASYSNVLSVSSESSQEETPASSPRPTGSSNRHPGGSAYSNNKDRDKSRKRISTSLNEARKSTVNSAQSQSTRRSLRLKSPDVTKVLSKDLNRSPVIELKRRSLIDSKKQSKTRKLFNPKAML